MRTPLLALLCTASLQLTLVSLAPARPDRSTKEVAVTDNGLSRICDRIADSEYGLMTPFEIPVEPTPEVAPVAPETEPGSEIPDDAPPTFYSDYQASLTANPTPDELRPIIWREARRNHVDPLLVEAVVRNESGFDARARSKAGALGLMQLMPGTAKMMGVGDALDPMQSISGGAQYLAKQLDAFQGDIELALAAYNAGPEAVIKYGGVPPFPETQQYVRRVLDDYRALQGLPPAAAGGTPASGVVAR